VTAQDVLASLGHARMVLSFPYKWMTYWDAGYVLDYYNNRREWLIWDHACSAYSYISVPLYHTLAKLFLDDDEDFPHRWLATTLASITTSESKCLDSRMSTALTSATELLARHFPELAESGEVDHDHVVSVVQSTITIHNQGDIMTLAAAAATIKEGAWARLQEPRLELVNVDNEDANVYLYSDNHEIGDDEHTDVQDEICGNSRVNVEDFVGVQKSFFYA
ncbi:VAN3-binding protein-like protein, partial [Tanacetum coccineum]